jgi:hypothetical protein
MQKRPHHRPHREYSNAKRIIIECDLETCPQCEQVLKARRPWHMRKRRANSSAVYIMTPQGQLKP